MEPIAHICTDFPTKFGIPRQAGLVPALQARIVFEPPYRVADALRGLEDFSHIWLIWEFSETRNRAWSPTVRPPRLGGNTRLGVFATRSPFRPNPIGLSCVKLDGIIYDPLQGPVLLVSGADLMDQTPIFDIKPYLPYADCHPEASGGFTDPLHDAELDVQIDPDLLAQIPVERQSALLGVLASDPRPRYQHDPQRVYGMAFGNWDIRFCVSERVLTVLQIVLRE